PVLPTGYAGMIVLAIVPAVWRRVMDPRVLRHFDGDLSRANLSPRKRDRILATYPPPSRAEEGATASVTSAGDVNGLVGEVLATRCPGCGYTYDVVSGDEREGFAAGTGWADVPEAWCCPDCGVREKADFVPVEASRV
ncbi:MAG: rubredoxin, partial [Nocardioides sp.]